MIKKILRVLKNEIKLLLQVIYYRLYISHREEKNVIDQFHKLYYYSKNKTWGQTHWLGQSVMKCPLDLWVYQEIIFETKPDIIIECGTASGGSALFLASLCDLIGNGQIITIDVIDQKDKPLHPRIKYLIGSSISPAIIQTCQNIIKSTDKVMVILDSDHHKSHVLKELKIYSKFVTKNNYLIVEDTNINGHPLHPEFGPQPGPMEAVKEFLATNNNFTIDKPREKFYLTFNPNGYLKKNY